jgi:predicted lipoprotein
MSPVFSWIALSAVTIVVGCLSSSSTDTTQQDTLADQVVAVSDVLSAVGPSVVLPSLEGVLAELDLLQQSVLDWESALSTDGEEDARVAAQQQWSTTMLSWQEIEVMQLGPAGSSLSAVAGADIRDEIYSWPTINPCRIDQETAEAAWSDSSFFDENLVNSYGLDALEHILWAEPGNVCPTQMDINMDGSWDRLGDDGVASNRVAFSLALVDGLRAQVTYLHDVWSPDGEDFSGQLALRTGSVYSSEQEALNAIFDALFYVETDLKDRKLAYPLGLRDCTADCSSDVEHFVSGLGIAAIEANLLGFQQLFTGNDGYGFDDLLVQLGHGDLSAQMLTDIDTAIALAGSLDMPLDDAIESRPDEIEALYNAVKAVTDALKGDLATVLVLEILAEATGDND